MNSVVTGLLQLVENLLPLVPGGSTIGMVIDTLEEIVPLAIKEYQDVKPFVLNIISTLKDDAEVTPEQLARLDALEKQADDAFDAAWARVQEEDKT